MKNLLWIGSAGVLAGGAVAATVAMASPAKRACEQLHTVCPAVEVADCTSRMKDASDDEIEDVLTCVEPADNCIEAAACLSGAVLRDAGQGFMRGVFETK